MKKPILVIILLLVYVAVAMTQEVLETDTSKVNFLDQNWIMLVEEITENCENEEVAEKWQEMLSELAENPIPLNSATKESLESIPFLSEAQVEALSYYIYRYSPLVSISELMLVEEMDEQTLRWLKPFVYLGKAPAFPIEMPPLKKAFKYGKQEISLRVGRSVQEKKGYTNINDSTGTKTYMGDPNHITFRYGFNYKSKIQWGLVLEKDAGEKIWNSKNKGLDYASFHFLLKDQKRIKSLIVGDYNLKFGQGLVCASSFSLGKNLTGTALEQTGTSMSRHFSSSESRFFRGIAATFVLKPYIWKNPDTKGKFGLEATTFASRKKMDATIDNNTFSTISTAELHRTKKESELNDQLSLYTMGGHLSLRTDYGQLGFTALAYRFSAEWNPEWKLYNNYYFRGRNGGNMSMDFRFRAKGIQFFGEMALDEKRNGALIAALSFKPYEHLDLSILGRNYDSKYNAYFSNAFSEGTATKNEKGFFAVIEWRLIRNFRLNAFYDVFVFPWLKYGVNAPSSGSDYALQATWIANSKSQVLVRFKNKLKQQNENLDEEVFPPIENRIKNQTRVQLTSAQGFWNLKTVLDGNSIESDSNGSATVGFSVSQEINYAPSKFPFSYSVRYALFDTDQFDNRIYSYERDLPGTFSMTSFYGKGSRYSLLLKYKFSKSFNVQFKVGHTAYRDRQAIGTALEEVQGNQLTDIRCLCTFKF